MGKAMQSDQGSNEAALAIHEKAKAAWVLAKKFSMRSRIISTSKWKTFKNNMGIGPKRR